MRLTAYAINTTAPGVPCPGCGTVIADVPDPPSASAISICAYCRLILTVTPERQLRILSNQEWAALSPEVRTFVTTVREGLAHPSSSKVSA